MNGSLVRSARSFRPRLSGTSAIALSTIATNLVRLISTICLTRLLSPQVYGITGMLISVFYTINMVTDIGLQAYVIRHHRSDEPEFLSSVFTIHAVRGVLLALTGVALAWPISQILAKPEVAAPLAVSSLIFVIEGLVSLHPFLGLRRGSVQRFAIIDLATGLGQTICGIALAFLLRNIWAIIASMFIGAALRVVAGYALFPGSRHVFRPDREISRDLWRFSRVIAVSSTLTLILAQIDKLTLGRLMSLSEFGTYSIAGSLASAPLAFAFNYTSAIVYPAAASAWRAGESLSDAYYSCWRRFFYLYAFAGGALIGGAPLLVRLIYDHRYWIAGDFLRLLAISTALSIVTRSMESVLVASGRQRAAIEFNVLRLVCLGTGGLLTLGTGNSMLLVWAVGLVEAPVYLFGLIRMRPLFRVRWARELSFWALLLTGAVAGEAATVIGRMILSAF